MDELIIEFRRFGNPTDLWGTFRGHQWDFWAKWGNWEFRLSETPAVLPELMTPDTPGIMKNGVFSGHEIEPEAALQIIRDCLSAEP